jgi:hypothetical protein
MPAFLSGLQGLWLGGRDFVAWILA